MSGRQQKGRVLVIGLGNPDRGDDGIGPLVAGILAGEDLQGVSVIVRSGDALSLIEDWAGADAVVMIDAAAAVRRPGCIQRIDLAAESLPRNLRPPSTHAFGMAEAIALARTLNRLPPQLVVYAIEGACFDPGAEMTAEVAAAAGEVAARVTGELLRLRHVEGLAHA
jgi:hydrogenase maturation protease